MIKLLVFVLGAEFLTNKLTIGAGADRQHLFLCSQTELGLSRTFKQRSQPCSEKIFEQIAFGNGPKRYAKFKKETMRQAN